MKFAAFAIAFLVTSSALAQEEKPLTVNDCMTIAKGLSALGYVGQQLDDPRPVPADTKQYRFGAARLTIALDLAAIKPITDSFQSSYQQMIKEFGDGKPIQPNSPEMAKLMDAMQVALDKPCGLTLGRIKAADLKLDGPDENAIPVNVLATFTRIIDK